MKYGITFVPSEGHPDPLAAVLRHGECLTEESLYSAADTRKTPDYEREQFGRGAWVRIKIKTSVVGKALTHRKCKSLQKAQKLNFEV